MNHTIGGIGGQGQTRNCYPRAIQLGKAYTSYAPMIREILLISSIFIAIEVGRYFTCKDPQGKRVAFKRIFVVVWISAIFGVIVYHLVIDKLLGSGAACCGSTLGPCTVPLAYDKDYNYSDDAYQNEISIHKTFDPAVKPFGDNVAPANLSDNYITSRDFYY